MAVSYASLPNMLGSGLRPPTCWQVFGFDGPVNRYNLDNAWRDAVNQIAPAGEYNARRMAFLGEQYKLCLLDLGEEST